MRSYYLRLLVVTFVSYILFSCSGPSKQELAQKRLEQAKQFLNKNDFNNAKYQIDSIEILYPDQIEYIAKGQKMLDKVELAEQRSSLAYFDSVYTEQNQAYEKLVKNFIKKPSGVIVHKKQDVSKNYNRTYLKAYLDKKGTFYITSKFFGQQYIYHNQIKVYDSGLFAETLEVPEDDADNKRFDFDGDKWETVNYRGKYDNGVANFIVNNADKRLKVQYKGKKHTFIVMETNDKIAIRDAFILSKLMTHLKQLKTDISNCKKRIKLLEERSN